MNINTHGIIYDEIANNGREQFRNISNETPLPLPARSASQINQVSPEASPSAVASPANSWLHKIHDILFNRSPRPSISYEKLNLKLLDHSFIWFKINLKTGYIVSLIDPKLLDLNLLLDLEKTGKLNFLDIMDLTLPTQTRVDPVDIWRRNILVQEILVKYKTIDLINLKPETLFSICNNDRISVAWTILWTAMKK